MEEKASYPLVISSNVLPSIFSQIGNHRILVLSPGLRETTLTSFMKFFSSSALEKHCG